MRAVLDPNVLVSALLSRTGPPARALEHWRAGDFELVVSGALLEELGRVLGYAKLKKHVAPHEAEAFVELLRQGAIVAPQPDAGSFHSVDPDDDYLLALAEVQPALLVTGDEDLLGLADAAPVMTPRAFVDRL